ncbi:MAG: hypothetical protein SGI92_24290 [Bryobacteraceae bacterium]|nr:hypothetical protein [Bryobacteraceae bacterium]
MNSGRRVTAALWIFLLITGFGLAGRARQKPFWFDEIVTLKISEQTPGPAMWAAVTAGFDFTPPGIHMATRLSEQAFGRGPVTSRLPSILCGLVVLLCAFRVASRQGGVDAGFWAVFALSFSGVTLYFFEGRAYAMVLAGIMASWFCWQGLNVDPRFRMVKLAGLAGGLKLALASHVWAVVAPPCFAAGVLARAVRTGKMDWGALAASLFPLGLTVAYKPLIEASRRILWGGPIYNNSLPDGYLTVLGHLPNLVGMAVVVSAAGFLLYRQGKEAPAPEPQTLYLEDYIVAGLMIAAPAGIWLVTWLAHGSFMTRYALVAGLGIAFLFAQAMAAATRWVPQTSRALLVVVGVGLTVFNIRCGVLGFQWEEARPAVLEALADAAGDQPVVMANGLRFLEADLYADARTAKRLVFVADPEKALARVGTDGVDGTYWNGQSYLHLRGLLMRYDTLRRRGGEFYLVSERNDPLDWIGEELRRDGALVSPVRDGQFRVWRVLLR